MKLVGYNVLLLRYTLSWEVIGYWIIKCYCFIIDVVKAV